jgi:hypothetical protein
VTPSPLLRRVLAEKRRVAMPLAVALGVNVLVYALVAHPLGVQSAGAADRAAAAAVAAQAAERELEAARALVTGKARADEELNAFYQKVLPADLAAARRLTYASLPRLAERTNVDYLQRTFERHEVEAESSLGQLSVRVLLQGDYESIRDFVYQLESASEFVIIDEVTLVEGVGSGDLTLTLNLSTYYRAAGTDGD